MTVTHPDYAILAARIAVSNLHKQTNKVFSEVMTALRDYVNPRNNKHSPMIAEDVYKTIMNHADELDSAIVYDRDFNYQYFGFKTLERSYLLKLNGKVAERPQHMLMRVAVGIHGEDIPRAIETYNLLSSKFFTHASPTLFSAGTPNPQLASCFLVDMKADSIDGIYDTLKTCAMISKNAGGVGFNAHCIRATGSYIAGTNGTSNGLVPMLRVFNNTARYVDQGGNKRPGAFACYIEPWHADIFAWLDLRKNHGKEEIRARDLFYGLWVPDLFMKRVEENGEWTLFCPNEAPGMADCYGEEFERLYTRFVAYSLFLNIGSLIFMPGTRKRDAADKRFELKNSGMLFWKPKLRLVPLTCFTKTHAIRRAIRRTSVPSVTPISALRSLSTVLLMKSPCAILLLLHFLLMSTWRRVLTTSPSCTRLPRLWQET